MDLQKDSSEDVEADNPPFLESNENAVAMWEDVLEEDEAAMLLASPDNPASISPARNARVSLGKSEERNVDRILRAAESDKLKLGINTPGGQVNTAYKISKNLRDRFDEIDVFVMEEAKSGGTTISFVGDNVYMGPMSELGPIEPQVPTDEGMVSATTYRNAFENTKEELAGIHPVDSSVASQALADQLDIVQYQNMLESIERMEDNARQILERHENIGDGMAENIIDDFSDQPTHQYEILYDRASEILPDDMIHRSSEKPKEMSAFQRWFEAYSGAESASHHTVLYDPNIAE